MTAPRLPITVCIPTRNEERNLQQCLQSLADSFEQVFVVDSGSSDATAQVASAFGAEVVSFAWNGRFPKKRNWFLRNHHFKTPWVLFLDADERLTPAVIDELREVLPETTHSGYVLAFNNWFMGRQLKHGDPFAKLALFRVGAGEYERIENTGGDELDMEVHEHPVIQGTVGKLGNRLEHHDYKGLHHYIAKHNAYSTWEAKRFVSLQQGDAGDWERLTKRQQLKYRNLDQWWLAWLYWFASLVARRGVLDGLAGVRFACFKRRYFTDIRLKIFEHRRNGEA
jgi:glycosyltransferase involved in cell wall biosynthesis